MLFACIPLSVYGASDRPFEAAADLVTNSIKTPSYGWSAGSSYYLGDSIPVYTPEQGELVLHDDTAFFPVYQGSKIAGILTEINSGQRNVSYNFSKSFAEELDSVTQSGTKDFILVLNARQVFAYCDSTATELVCYDIPLNTGENDINASFVVTAASRLPSISANKSCASNKKQLPISNAATRDPDTMFSVLNVDEWTQKKGSNRCWAATVWCIGEYMYKGSGYLYDDSEALAKDIGIGWGVGQDLPQVITHLQSKYHLAYTRYPGNGLLPLSTFEQEINEFQPLALCWWQNNDPALLAHMVTGCGYCKNSSGVIDEIGVMDSIAGEVIWVLRGSDGMFTEQMGTHTYTWRNAATKD